MLYVPASRYPPGRHPAVASATLVRSVDVRPLDHGAPIAKMYVSGSGGGIRRLVGGAHRHVIPMRRDPQMQFGQPTEGIVEGPAMIRCATDPDIVFYQFQPFRLVFPFLSRLGEWICDLIYVTADGAVWVREIKRSAADLTDPEYTAKLETVAWLVARLGWTFKPWLRAEIEGPPERQINAATIYFDRAAHIDDLLPRFERLVVEQPFTTYGDLITALEPGNPARARAAVHRLIMRGRVWADLDILLEGWSEVRLRPAREIDAGLPFA